MAAGVVVLAVLGFAAFEFAGQVAPASHSGAGGSPGGAGGRVTVVTSGSVPPAASANATAPAGSGTSPAASSSASRSPATPSSRATARSARPSGPATGPQQALSAVSAVAFGPNGTSDGDNPQLAGEVLSDPAAGWTTDWYATSAFGGLKQGTGLLLDMGRAVTIASVRVNLGQTTGATIELRAGAQPAADGFATVAVRQDAGGRITLTPSVPVSARYVLLWFTKLPPNGNGTYQAFVHQVTVEGQL